MKKIITLLLIVFVGYQLNAQDYTILNKAEMPVDSSQDRSPAYNQSKAGAGALSLMKRAFSTASSQPDWDLSFRFEASTAGHYGAGTDGVNFYTAQWNGDGFTKYDMDGANPQNFTISGVSSLRDLAYDGTYFYGSNASMNIYKMDLANKTLISTIPVTCTGVTGIRHITYDPTLEGGKGGFWIGQWNEMGAVSMTGAELIASVTGRVSDCAGSAYDAWTDPENPCLWLLTQKESTSNNKAVFQQFDIKTLSLTGVSYDCGDDVETDGISGGGACSYIKDGKLMLVADIQKEPNLILAYEIAEIAPPGSPAAVSELAITPGNNGALSAVISWANPTQAVDGSPLSGLKSISVYHNDQVVYTKANPVVGSADSYTATVATPGNYVYTVVAENSAGMGVYKRVSTWIGSDVPAAPASVVFTRNDAQANLSWSAPVVGLHGGYFTGAGIVYDVYRLPGDVLVSAEQAEQTFSEQILQPGNYTYKVVAKNAAGEGGSAGSNQLSFCVPVAVFPWSEYFDEATFPPVCWTSYNADGGGTSWTLYNGAAYHQYSSAGNQEGWLVTPQITVPATGEYILEFRSRNVSASNNEYTGIWVSVTGNDPISDTFTEVKQLTGNEISSLYQKIRIPLSDYAGDAVYFGFKYTGNDADAWYVDDVQVYDLATYVDAEVSAIVSPLSGINLGRKEKVKVKLKNNSHNPLAGFQLELKHNGVKVTNEAFTGTIASLAEAEYTFTATVDLSAAGTHSLAVTVKADNDLDRTNDSQTISVNNTVCDPITSFPWVENFDNGVPSCWTNTDNDGDGNRWGSGIIMYNGYSVVSSYSSSRNPDNYLITPQLRLGAGYFLHFIVGGGSTSYTENYSVLISTTGTATDDFTEIHTEAISINGFKTVTLSLAAYAGRSVYIAFRHWNSPDQYVLMIEEVRVSNVGNSIDAEVVSIMDPVSGFDLTTAETVKAVIRNNGSTDLTGFNLTLEVDGVEIATEIYPKTLLGFKQVEYVFTTPVDMSAFKNYNVKVTIDATDDEKPGNNSFSHTIENMKSDTDWYDSEDTELEISTASELAGLASLVNSGTSFAGKTVKLTADIWLNTDEAPTKYSWDPIGRNATATEEFPDDGNYYFEGTFDGDNHAIYNMYCDRTDYYQAGLFGGLRGDGTTIKNLALIYPVVKSRGMAGAIAGFAGDKSGNMSIYIENCMVVNGDVIGTENNNGSIIGATWPNGNYTDGYTYVKNCGATGNVQGVYIGGIAGNGNRILVENCYYSGQLTNLSQSHRGTICGYTDNITIANCYSDIMVSGSSYSRNATVVTTDYLKSADAVTALGASFRMDCGANRGYPILSWYTDCIEVKRFTPARNAEDVPVDNRVSVSFNKRDITALDLAQVRIYDDDRDETVSGVKATINGGTLNISHDNFKYNTTYRVRIPVGVIDGCENVITWSFITEQSTGLTNTAFDEVSLYPNPATEMVTLSGLPGEVVVTLYDFAGRTLKRYEACDMLNIYIDFESGIYLVKIEKDGQSVVKRLIVK